VQSITAQVGVRGGEIVKEDSALIKAVRDGHVC
jgi:hypothetical protein